MTSLGCQDEKVNTCAFNQQSTLCAFAYGNKVKVVDIRTRETIQVFEYMRNVQVFAFNYNNTLIIGSCAQGYTLLIFDMITGSVYEIKCYPHCVATAICSTHENMVYVGGERGVRYINADRKPYWFETICPPITSSIYNLKYNPISNMLMIQYPHCIYLMNATSLTEINHFYSSAFSGSFSNCGGFIVTTEPYNGICIYDLDGHRIRIFKNKRLMFAKKKKSFTSSAVFAQSDTLIVVRYSTDMVQILNAVTGDIVRTIDDHSYVPTNTYNYRNKYIATCTDQHEIILHNINNSGDHTKAALRYACNTSLNDTTLHDTSLDCALHDTSLDETSLDETSLDETSFDETSLDETSFDGALLNDVLLNKTSSHDASLNDVSCDTLPNNTFIIPNPKLELDLSELID